MKRLFTFILLVLFSFNIDAQSHRDSIDVLNYKISLTISDFSEKTISGYTNITLKPTFDNTSIIKLDFWGLEVEKIKINDKKYKRWTQNDSLIIFNFKNSVSQEDILNIEVHYAGKPKEDRSWGGFYFSKVDAFNMGVGMSAIPHSFGRVWFPCNDNFTDKATYEYYIRVNDKYKVSAGGREIPLKMKPEDEMIFHWKQKNPIPTYLASIAIADYEIISDVYNGIERDIPIKIYSFRGKKAETEQSLENLKKVMRVFEELFGAYKWEKIGYSEVSFSSGAMEHAENISISKYAFNGRLTGESLIYHELSHSWFGNLVTCESAKDMWLNEGWASYCESIFIENIYSKFDFREYNRKRHFEVLHLAHQYDYGYRAVGNMDINHTYGTTVYEKGAEVVHTLRNYMGDSLFFPAVRHYLEKYAFANASTEDLKNTLEENSGLELDAFFDFWVYEKGFTHFEITNYVINKKDKNYEITVFVNQRLLEVEKYANENRLEISFMDSNFNTVHRVYEFSGEKGKQTFEIPFEPTLVLLDMFEKTSDATVDMYSFIANPDIYIFDQSLFDANITKVTDTSFLRVICNVIEPTNIKKPGYKFQKNYYWTIEGIWNEDFQAKGYFYITRLMDMNFTKLYKPKDFIMMYRENPKSEWQEIESDYRKDYLEADLKIGEYAIAVKTYE